MSLLWNLLMRDNLSIIRVLCCKSVGEKNRLYRYDASPRSHLTAGFSTESQLF